MTTMLLVMITILFTLILAVLVHHIPKQEWIALLDLGLRLCWATLMALVPVSMAVITIVWEARHHRELSFFVNTIPFFFLCLSFAPFAILHRDEYTLWKALRLAAQWILMALGLLLFAFWDPIPQLLPTPIYTTTKEFTGGWPYGDILSWGTVLLFAFFSIHTMKEEFPWRLGVDITDPSQPRN